MNVKIKEQKYIVLMVVSIFWILGISFGVAAREVDLGDFVRTGIGARSQAMGGAYVAVGGDSSSSFWNPAAVTSLDSPRFGGMYTDKFSAGIIYQYLAGIGVIELKKNPSNSHSGDLLGSLAQSNPISGTLGAGLTRIGMDIGNMSYSAGESFGEARSLWLGSMGYGFPSGSLLDGLAVGGNLKKYNRTLSEDSASGWGYDFGVMYKNDLGLSDVPLMGKIGLTLQDPGGVELVPEDGDNLEDAGVIPPYNRVGLAFRYNSALPILISTEYDFSPTRPQLNRTSFGAEVSIVDIFFFRVGINKWAREDNLNYVTGAGFDVGQFSIDYALIPHEALGSTNILSLDFSF